MSLIQLGKACGTDKYEHGFLPLYDSLFESFKNSDIFFLEIGVFFGSSIKMWSTYFPNGIIYGIDSFAGKQGNGNYFENADKFYNEWLQYKSNIELFKVDQSVEGEVILFTQMCKEKNIKFKVILDDGSHLMYDQQLTFNYLFELLDDDGFYIIEDTHTCDQAGYDVMPNKLNSTKNCFKTNTFTSVYNFSQSNHINFKSAINYEIKPHSQTMVIRP